MRGRDAPERAADLVAGAGLMRGTREAAGSSWRRAPVLITISPVRGSKWH